MDTVTSLRKWVSGWVERLRPATVEEARARVRLALKEEQAKPAGQRDAARLWDLREEDNMLTYDYCRVCWRARV